MDKECELLGNVDGAELPLEDDMTAISDSLKNSEINEMYSLTISSAIVRHWVGLRRDCEDED